jgi:hypothetical protein
VGKRQKGIQQSAKVWREEITSVAVVVAVTALKIGEE